MDESFWKNRRVLITGHTGFKGSWLALWLRALSADVVGYALGPPTRPALFDVAGVADGMRSIIGDVRDFPRLRDAIAGHRPEIVFHMAAQSVVRASYADPVETYSTNVMGTVHVLEAMRHLPGPWAIVNVTTDKVYRNNEWVWGYRESDDLGGHDPYASSKACSELATQSFVASYLAAGGASDYTNRRVATARAGNVIGGGDWTADQLVPDAVRAFGEGRPVSLRNPDHVRPWQFVLDCLLGYVTLAERLATDREDLSGPWNFGPAEDQLWRVADVVERLASRWPKPARWVHDGGVHPHETRMLRLDSSKSRQMLGWKPVLPIEEALDWIVEWYGGHYDGQPAATLCRTQIDRYRERIIGT
jgi:CDP-glucose 4,6-dehydratase